MTPRPLESTERTPGAASALSTAVWRLAWVKAWPNSATSRPDALTLAFSTSSPSMPRTLVESALPVSFCAPTVPSTQSTANGTRPVAHLFG